MQLSQKMANTLLLPDRYFIMWYDIQNLKIVINSINSSQATCEVWNC
jgi:hypothetical protein